uniref:Uncharacterized protein n=1 Tax=Mycena chlorophos TaxID=658473 RepID=A0ABQ0LL44_MYCCL|nr:predicted protein [Mycena chlorophos]
METDPADSETDMRGGRAGHLLVHRLRLRKRERFGARRLVPLSHSSSSTSTSNILPARTNCPRQLKHGRDEGSWSTTSDPPSESNRLTLEQHCRPPDPSVPVARCTRRRCCRATTFAVPSPFLPPCPPTSLPKIWSLLQVRSSGPRYPQQTHTSVDRTTLSDCTVTGRCSYKTRRGCRKSLTTVIRVAERHPTTNCGLTNQPRVRGPNSRIAESGSGQRRGECLSSAYSSLRTNLDPSQCRVHDAQPVVVAFVATAGWELLSSETGTIVLVSVCWERCVNDRQQHAQRFAGPQLGLETPPLRPSYHSTSPTHPSRWFRQRTTTRTRRARRAQRVFYGTGDIDTEREGALRSEWGPIARALPSTSVLSCRDGRRVWWRGKMSDAPPAVVEKGPGSSAFRVFLPRIRQQNRLDVEGQTRADIVVAYVGLSDSALDNRPPRYERPGDNAKVASRRYREKVHRPAGAHENQARMAMRAHGA